jgi:hypothetical protein
LINDEGDDEGNKKRERRDETISGKKRLIKDSNKPLNETTQQHSQFSTKQQHKQQEPPKNGK